MTLGNYVLKKKNIQCAMHYAVFICEMSLYDFELFQDVLHQFKIPEIVKYSIEVKNNTNLLVTLFAIQLQKTSTISPMPEKQKKKRCIFIMYLLRLGI